MYTKITLHIVAIIQALIEEIKSVSVRSFVEGQVEFETSNWHRLKFPNHIEGGHAPSNDLHFTPFKVRICSVQGLTHRVFEMKASIDEYGPQ